MKEVRTEEVNKSLTLTAKFKNIFRKKIYIWQMKEDILSKIPCQI